MLHVLHKRLSGCHIGNVNVIVNANILTALILSSTAIASRELFHRELVRHRSLLGREQWTVFLALMRAVMGSHACMAFASLTSSREVTC